jgi:hypothetical protein
MPRGWACGERSATHTFVRGTTSLAIRRARNLVLVGDNATTPECLLKRGIEARDFQGQQIVPFHSNLRMRAVMERELYSVAAPP